MAPRQPQQQRTYERYLPIAYFAVALLLVVIVLPTALRPPPDQSHTSAELSPDAPPNDQQDSIVSTFNRGESATAGAGTQGVATGEGGPGDGAGPGITPAPASAPAPARGCPRGFGNPPRQTWSIYSAPCAPAFTGNNGGKTWTNVTGNEVRVAFNISLGQPDYDGPIRTAPDGNENGSDRTARVLQQWFNDRYQFWGRRLQLVAIDGSDSSTSGSQAAAIAAASQYKAFAGIYQFPAFGEVFANKGLVFWGNGYPNANYESHAPYWWSYLPDTDFSNAMGAEFMCKQLVGGKASFAGAALQNQDRVFGMIANSEDNRRFTTADMAAPFGKQCGGKFAAWTDMDGAGDTSSVSTAVAKMRQNNVTSIVLAADLTPAEEIMAQASAQGYYPEWLIFYSTTCDDCNLIGKLLPQDQMAHTMAMSTWEEPRSDEETDCFRAYHEIDPDNDPDSATCTLLFLQLTQVVNGIQMAGPNLTPQTFQRGLFSLGQMIHPEVWATQGGYGPGDHTLPDRMGILWWDPSAIDPGIGSPGAYRWSYHGTKFGRGQVPSGPPVVFKEGDTRPPPSSP